MVIICGLIYLIYTAYFFYRHKFVLKGLNKFLVFSWIVELGANFIMMLYLSRSQEDQDANYVFVLSFIWIVLNSFNIIIWWIVVFRVKTLAIYMNKNFKSEQQIG